MVTVLLQTASHYPVNRTLIRQAVAEALDGKVRRDAEVSVTVVGDRQMRKLNRTYRNIDATTDVLSFPLNETSAPQTPFVSPPGDVLRLGDIVVSYPQAVNEAREENMLVDDKINQLVLHGLNHLLGIHHPE